MIKERIEILFLSEAHVNTNSTEKHGDYIFFFSTNVTEADRKKLRKRRKNNWKPEKVKVRERKTGGTQISKFTTLKLKN